MATRRGGGGGPGSGRSRVERWLPVFAFAVLVRGIYWAVVLPGWKPQADADQYVRLSHSLAAGRGFALVYPQLEMHATAFRPPLYPLLLTPGSLVFGHALWPVRLVSVLLGSVVVVLVGMLAARIAGRTAGLIAPIIVAVYPPLLANDTVSLSEPLALSLLLGAILLVDENRPVPAGIAVGALLLTRPNGYLVLAILVAWTWRRVGWRPAAGLAGVAFLVFVPWLVRNQVQVGTWRPTTSDGLTLAAVYGKPAQNAGTFVDPVFSSDYDDLEDRVAQFDEASWNAKLTREAVAGLKGNPRYLGHVVWQNAAGYFEIDPSLNVFPEVNDGRSMRFRSDTLVLFYAVSLVGLAGLVRNRRDERVIVLALIVGQFVLLSLVLVAPPRLRAPFDVAMCVGLGVLLGPILDRRRTAD